MANYQSRYLILTLLFAVLSVSNLYGQRTLGVTWDIPNNQSQAIAELQSFNQLGVSIIEIEESPAPFIWQQIDSLDLKVYGSLGIHFPTSSTFQQADSSLIRDIEEKASAYLSQPSVVAIGLFDHGATGQGEFWEGLIPFVNQLKTERQLPFYYTGQQVASVDTLQNSFVILSPHITAKNVDTFTIPADTLIGGYRYSISNRLDSYVTPFKIFLERTSASPEKPILVSSTWLLSMKKQHPRFAETIQTLTSAEDGVFPLPKETLPLAESSSLPTILLLLVWGTIAFHYHSSPIYRKSLFRYFTAHKFFINDIFNRQIRSPLPAVIIIFQHAILLASAVFVAAISMLSPLGQSAFFHHFPELAVLGTNFYSVWAVVLLGIVLISFICNLWLYLSHKSINSFTQIATIYAWPLQVNFVLTTVAITLFSSGAAPALVLTLTSLAVIIFLLAFFFTALDATRFSRFKVAFQLKTTIPYILLWIGVSIWILLEEQWLEALSLAVNLK